MIPRTELMDLLRVRLDGRMPREEIDRLAGEVLGLEGGWEEMEVAHRDLGYSHSDLCSSICWIASQVEHGSEIKMYRKKK